VGINAIGLMRFIHGLRSDFFEKAASLGWREFTRDRGVSLGSCRKIFLHLAVVEEQHVTQFCEGRATPWPPSLMRMPKNRYRDVASIRRRLSQVTALAENRFRKWDNPKGLAKRVVWVADKYPLRVSRETALTQCATEHLLHLGEVEAVLWQLDVQPPLTHWIWSQVLHKQWPPPRSLIVRPTSRASRARNAS
jgi:uncharacterized damage-inducible protein DinB